MGWNGVRGEQRCSPAIAVLKMTALLCDVTLSHKNVNGAGPPTGSREITLDMNGNVAVEVPNLVSHLSARGDGKDDGELGACPYGLTRAGVGQ